MIIGDLSNFATEFELNDEYGGPWLFGKFCYWIGGTRIGEFELGTSLRDVLFLIEPLVRDKGNRSNENLFSLDSKELFSRLDSALYDVSCNFDSIATEETWARFNVCLPLDIFNHWKIFLVEEKDKARFVMKKLDSSNNRNDILEYVMQAGDFDTVIVKTYQLLSEVYDREIGDV